MQLDCVLKKGGAPDRIVERPTCLQLRVEVMSISERSDSRFGVPMHYSQAKQRRECIRSQLAVQLACMETLLLDIARTGGQTRISQF